MEGISSAHVYDSRHHAGSARLPVAETRPHGDSPRGERGASPDLPDAQRATQSDRAEKLRLLDEQREIQRLSRRDREVRAHEQAHAAIGGVYAGSPAYEYERGPNGVRYAVGGHVNIDVSPVAGDPEQTVRKMMIVRRAALAPAEPSTQDRRVAAQASQIAAQARVEVLRERSESLDVPAGREAESADDRSRVREGMRGAFVDVNV